MLFAQQCMAQRNVVELRGTNGTHPSNKQAASLPASEADASTSRRLSALSLELPGPRRWLHLHASSAGAGDGDAIWAELVEVGVASAVRSMCRSNVILEQMDL